MENITVNLWVAPGEPPISERLAAEFPHISKSDIIAVLAWVGFSTNDLFRDCAYIDVNGARYYIPGVLIEEGLRRQIGTPFDIIPA